MRLIIAILSFIVLNGVIGKTAAGSAEENGDANEANGCALLRNDENNPSKGDYTYEINAIRTRAAIHNVLYRQVIIWMSPEPEPVQNITYFENIDKDNPFTIAGMILLNGSMVFGESIDSPNPIKSCDKLDNNSWRYVFIELTVKGLMPDGKCPVNEGVYQINQVVEPITVTFDSMISCGDYEVVLNLYRNTKWAGWIYFSFNIPENDNCISKKN